MLFGSRKKKVDLTRQDALGAKPTHLVKATVLPTDDGGAKLTVPLQTTRWTGMIFRMPAGASKTFELDEIGLFIWNSCDGRTSVQQMIRQLARERKVTLREVEVATLQFLQTLIRKGLIGVEIKQPKAAS